MPLSKDQKKEIVKNLSKKLKSSKSVVFADFTGLTVFDMESLRSDLREQEAYYQVIKKNLLKIDLEQAGLKVKLDNISGAVSVAMSESDEVVPAKILHEFSANHENLKLIKGILDNKEVNLKVLEKLAKLPGKDELRAKTVGILKGNLYGMVNVLQGNIRGLVYALNAIKSNK
ncbi:50S ribosomal protein L10 [bacterium]|nr:50S ribosomal protein L10 [bacterium]